MLIGKAGFFLHPSIFCKNYIGMLIHVTLLLLLLTPYLQPLTFSPHPNTPYHTPYPLLPTPYNLPPLPAVRPAKIIVLIPKTP